MNEQLILFPINEFVVISLDCSLIADPIAANTANKCDFRRAYLASGFEL